MNKNNTYIFIYATVMIVIVAVLLSVASITLKPYQERNIEIEKKQNILASINIISPANETEADYEKYITNTYVLNGQGDVVDGVDAFNVDLKAEIAKKPENRNLPVFEAALDGGEHIYILPVRGKGLWGPIWGYIALSQDMNTVYGATFGHKGETPGLGAEIANTPFQEQFKGKKIFDPNGSFVGINVVKGGAVPNDLNGVDAISGGTITSRGVDAMLKDCLSAYSVFFAKNKK